MKICPVGGQLFQQRDQHGKANSSFFANLIKTSSVYISYDLLVHSTECKCVCDTYIAQHLTSTYSAIQHTNFIQPPSKAHHICIPQCKLNFRSLSTENCKTDINKRRLGGGKEGNSCLTPFTVNANILFTSSTPSYILAGARFFAHNQTGPGAHPASFTMSTGLSQE
jgi:hypothetical protein